MSPGMNLSPTETSARFGISIKALRLYEQRGLLTPLRSEAGWRSLPGSSCRIGGMTHPNPAPSSGYLPPVAFLFDQSKLKRTPAR